MTAHGDSRTENAETVPAPLTEPAFAEAVDALCAIDADLAAVVRRFGAPALRLRPPGFATVMLLILEQQVSLASAAATYRRLDAAVAGALTPQRFLALDDGALKAVGFSRQKASYGRALAEAVAGGALDLGALAALGDDAVRTALTAVRGIGRWTADIYLMTALARPDIWPAGDLALAVAAGKVKGVEARPGDGPLVALGDAWRPWRAVAARILWHYYLATVRKGKAG